jgi:hypothetical protein
LDLRFNDTEMEIAPMETDHVVRIPIGRAKSLPMPLPAPTPKKPRGRRAK